MRDPVLTGEARLLSGERLEALGAGRFVIVSHSHGFGADALLLADFAAPRWGERALDLGTGCGILPLFGAGRASWPMQPAWRSSRRGMTNFVGVSF